MLVSMRQTSCLLVSSSYQIALRAVVVRDLFYNQPVRRKYIQSRCPVSWNFTSFFFSQLPSSVFSLHLQYFELTWHTFWFVYELSALRRSYNQSRNVYFGLPLCTQSCLSKLLIWKGIFCSCFIVESFFYYFLKFNYFFFLHTFFISHIVRTWFFARILLLPCLWWPVVLGSRSLPLFMNWRSVLAK